MSLKQLIDNIKELNKEIRNLKRNINKCKRTYYSIIVNKDVENKFFSIKWVVPSKTYPLDPRKVNQYINQQCSKEIQKIIRKIINNTTHITFKEFMKQLLLSKDEFEKAIKDEPYYVSIKTDNDEKAWNKSNIWVTKLIYPFLKHKPEHIIYDIDKFDGKLPEIMNLVLFDDAVYTGSQMGGIIAELLDQIPSTVKYVKIHIISPFMSCDGIILIESRYTQLYYTYKMNVIETILSNEELNYMGKIVDFKYFYTFNDLAIPIYFDHKLPDSLSSFPLLYRGVDTNIRWNSERWARILKLNPEDNPYPENKDKIKDICTTDERQKSIYLISNCHNKLIKGTDKEEANPCPYPPYKDTSPPESKLIFDNEKDYVNYINELIKD